MREWEFVQRVPTLLGGPTEDLPAQAFPCVLSAVETTNPRGHTAPREVFTGAENGERSR